jgi:hypothetical protein
MRRVLFFLNLLFFSALCFTQQNSNFRVIGRVPGAGDNRIYQIQVGAFLHFQNAERAFERLNNASLNPAYESFSAFTRVVINGIAARDVPSYLQRIRNAGFTEVVIRIDNNGASPVNASETNRQTTREEETVNPAVITEDRTPRAAIEETPAPFVPAEETNRPPVAPGQLLPAPGNRRPESGYRIGAEELRQQRNIVFRWSAVEGATSYILSIYRETPQGRRQIFITEPTEQLSFTFVNLELFENTGTYVWQVEALFINRQGIIEQRGRPGENAFTLNVPRPGRIETRDTGVLYGN